MLIIDLIFSRTSLYTEIHINVKNITLCASITIGFSYSCAFIASLIAKFTFLVGREVAIRTIGNTSRVQ